MPTVLRWRGHRFVFFSLDEGEPPHIHVLKDNKEAKFWLADCRLERSKGFAQHELNRLQPIVQEHREAFLKAWHDHFGG